MIMLCEDEDEVDLFEEGEDKLLTDDDILLLLLEECINKPEPVHRQYHRSDIASLSEIEFLTQFRFKRSDMHALIRALRLKKMYTGSNGIRWSAEEGLCILFRRLVTLTDWLI